MERLRNGAWGAGLAVGAAARRAQEAGASCRLSLGRQNPSGQGSSQQPAWKAGLGARQGLQLAQVWKV